MSKHQDKSVKMTLSAPAPKAETDSNHSMRDTVSMHKRLSAERENAVLKTYFVLTQVQGLRDISRQSLCAYASLPAGILKWTGSCKTMFERS